MIFGAGRQISSLQEKIRELEAERNLLSNQVEQAHAEQSQLEKKTACCTDKSSNWRELVRSKISVAWNCRMISIRKK